MFLFENDVRRGRRQGYLKTQLSQRLHVKNKAPLLIKRTRPVGLFALCFKKIKNIHKFFSLYDLIVSLFGGLILILEYFFNL